MEAAFTARYPGADLGFEKGGGGTANHGGENAKVNDIHDLLISVRSNDLVVVEKSGFSSFSNYVENAQRNTESYYLLQHKHSKSPASHLRMPFRIIMRIRTCCCTRTYRPVSFPCIRPQTFSVINDLFPKRF